MDHRSRPANLPSRIVSGAVLALPIAGAEFYMLVCDGPWWLPHQAGGTVVTPLYALVACTFLGALVAHTVVLRTRNTSDLGAAWTKGGEWLHIAFCVAIFVGLFAFGYVVVRKGIALGIVAAILACHAHAIAGLRKVA